MDTALNKNGDFNTDNIGQVYFISGTDEIKQKVYILLSAKLGEFIYDRTLGSDIYKINLSEDTAINKITAQARKALSCVSQAEVIKVKTDNGNIIISVKIYENIYDIELRI